MSTTPPREFPAESTQFSDAIQRAEFASSMEPNWHTELAPQLVDNITITVPKFVTVRFRRQNVQAINYVSGIAADGNRFVLMLNLFFNQQLGIIMNNEIDAGNFTTDAFNLPLLPNTFLYSFNPQQSADSVAAAVRWVSTPISLTGARRSTAGSLSSPAGFLPEFSAADLKT